MLIKKPIAKLGAKETRLGLEPKKKTVKKVIKNQKTKAAKKVLQYMDMGVSYSVALKKVLLADKRLNKRKLENDLNIWI